MEKLKSTLPNMLIVLTGICVIAGAILAAVNNMTAGPIAEAQALALEQAIKDVTPEFNNKPSEEAFMAVTPEGDSLKVYPAKMDGELVGVAVESINRNYKAFSGDIKVVVGFDANGKILSTPTPLEILRTVKVWVVPAPFLCITTPRNFWSLSLFSSLIL